MAMKRRTPRSKDEILNDIHALAKEAGGRCLTKAWKPTTDVWSFECANGHRLRKKGSEVLRTGLYCRKCEEEETFRAVKRAAASVGAKCLEKRYKKLRERWRFECKNGHRLTRQGMQVLHHELTCSECQSEETQERLAAAAEDLGWTILSRGPLTYKGRCRFRCENGHELIRSVNAVIENGGSCEHCAGEVIFKKALEIAESRGGRVITKKYRSTTEEWAFECENGHRFSRPGKQVIYEGMWCNQCTNRAPGVMLERVQEAARQRGGKCLSKTYMLNPKKMQFECSEGHRWRAIGANILHANQWCPTCAKTPTKALKKALADVLKEKRGRMVSARLGLMTDMHRFECSVGHRFSQAPSRVVHKGTWCPTCGKVESGKKQRLDFESVQAKAASMGGECLASEYRNQTQVARWRCGKGHEWQATIKSVMQEGGTWCPECWIENRRLGIEVAREAAEEHGGECLSSEYRSARDIARWRCAQGHEWQTRFYNVISQGTWCPECARDRSYLVGAPRSDPRPLSIEDCQALAERNDGICLTGYYVNYEHPMAWRCKRKHEWMAPLRAMEFRENFCTECAEIERKQEKLQEVHEWAGERGGRCLTPEWTNKMTKMEWRCEKGHEWRASMHSMEQRERFCSDCADEERRQEWIDKAHAFAESNNGECLSTEWVRATAKLKWQCSNGHTFERSWNQVIIPPFCSQCDREEKYQESGAARLKEIAKKHNGHWIEEPYRGLRARYRWVCSEGIEFRATPAVASKTWHKRCRCSKRKAS